MAIDKNGQWIQSKFNERLLPNGYTQLEYIESTGTQWIDSNVIMSENISYEAEGSIIEQSSTSDAAFCGTRDSGDNNTRFITWWNDYTVTGGRINQSYFTNSDSANYVTEYGKIYKLSMKNKVFSINDAVQKFFTGTVTNSNSLTFALFGLKYSATTTDSRRFKGRIYWFKIWDNNKLVRDFIPALHNSDQVPGLYDLVNGIFYTNAGTGEFKYILKGIPSDYIQLEYIQSSGTQYIDTGVSGNDIAEYEIEFDPLDSRFKQYEQYFAGDKNATNNIGKIYENTNKISYQESTSTSNQLGILGGGILNIKVLKDIGVISNGEIIKTYTGKPWGTLSFYIFNSHGEPTLFSTMKLYKLKMYSNDELIRDFIPVKRKSDNVLGLFDKVNNTFYTNSGTGTFTSGNPYAETTNVKIYKETNTLEANEFWEI